MEILAINDILALNQALGDIYATRDLDSLYLTLFSSLQSIIPSELYSFSEATSIHPLRFQKIVASSEEHDKISKTLLPTFNTHLHEHPLNPHVFTGEAVKTTDFVSKAQFKATAIHNEYYRHLDIDIQICLSIAISPERISILGLSRKNSDFSERDRLILTLLRPHLINALRNVTELGRLRQERDLLDRGAERQNKGTALCQANGMLICITAFARELLSRYFAVMIDEGDFLPGVLLSWLATEAGPSSSTGQTGSPPQVERDAFTVKKEGRCLTIKRLNDVSSGDCLLLLSETDPAALVQKLQVYGLSPRETEVLLWLTQGKTNPEIGLILGMSRRTVEKHLEHIFTKLGVETRAAVVTIIGNESASF